MRWLWTSWEGNCSVGLLNSNISGSRRSNVLKRQYLGFEQGSVSKILQPKLYTGLRFNGPRQASEINHAPLTQHAFACATCFSVMCIGSAKFLKSYSCESTRETENPTYQAEELMFFARAEGNQDCGNHALIWRIASMNPLFEHIMS